MIRLCALSIVLWPISAHSAERIASLNACTDELLLQLSNPAEIAGVTRLKHSPPAEEVLENYPGIVRMPGDVESVLKAAPALVLAGPFSNALLLERLRESGTAIQLMTVPRSWDEFLNAVREIEKVTGSPERAEVLKSRIAVLKNAARKSGLKDKRAVFWSAAGHVSGRGTFEDEMIRTLAMQNAAEFTGYAFFALEKLIELKPEVIIVTQDPARKDSWSHETLFHPALKTALPDLKYIYISEEAAGCASPWTITALESIVKKEK